MMNGSQYMPYVYDVSVLRVVATFAVFYFVEFLFRKRCADKENR